MAQRPALQQIIADLRGIIYPDDNELKAIQIRLLKLEEDAKRNDKRIKHSYAFIRFFLRFKQNYLLEYTSIQRGILAPIRKLPDEVLLHIFNHCRQEDEFDNLYWSASAVLSHVSTVWRQLVISTPSLWSRMRIEKRSSCRCDKHFKPPTRSKPLELLIHINKLGSEGFIYRSVSHVLSCVSAAWHQIAISTLGHEPHYPRNKHLEIPMRSKTVPVKIYIKLGKCDCIEPDIIHFLTQRVDRIEDLSIPIHYFHELMRNVSQNTLFPQLKSLTLSYGFIGIGNVTNYDLSKSTPFLTKLTYDWGIYDSGLDVITLPWEQITHLALFSESENANLYNLIKSMKNITRLEVSSTHSTAASVEPPTEPIKLIKLLDLRIRGWKMQYMLDTIIAPNIKRLTMDGGCKYYELYDPDRIIPEVEKFLQAATGVSIVLTLIRVKLWNPHLHSIKQLNLDWEVDALQYCIQRELEILRCSTAFLQLEELNLNIYFGFMQNYEGKLEKIIHEIDQLLVSSWKCGAKNGNVLTITVKPKWPVNTTDRIVAYIQALWGNTLGVTLSIGECHNYLRICIM